MEPHPGHAPRIGTFFLLVGVISLFIFIASGFSPHPAFSFLFLSLVTFLIGYLFRRRASRPSSNRFNLIRRMRENDRQRQEEKKK